MNRMLYLVFTVTIFIAAAACPAVSGQMYSLFELSKMADKQSENIKIAKDDIYFAEQEKARAMSVLIPRASAYGAITEYKDEDYQMPDNVTWGGKLTQSFTINGKELIALDVTKKDIEAKKTSLETVRSQYLLQVAQTYYDILSARRLVEIAESDVERLGTYKDAVQEKLNVGNVTKTDLYRAQAELSKAKTELVTAQSDVFKARAALINLVAIESDFDLERGYIQDIEDYRTTLDEIKTYALDNRSDVIEARENVLIAERTIDFERSDYWPTLSLEAGYRNSENSYQINSADVDSDREDYYASGELVFTLFDGGLRKAEIRQAQAKHRQALNALALTEKSVILESETSFRNFTAAKSAMINLEDELKASQENFKAVEMQFKYGMADSLDVMDANTLLVSAERRTLTAKYVYYLSVLSIIYTRGDLPRFLLSEID